MIDLGLNQYKIKEIKYELNNNKTVIFKLNNLDLEDVVVVDCPKKESPEEPDYHPFSSGEDYKKTPDNKQYEIDKTIIDEHIEDKENKIKNNFEKACKASADRCKDLINALDGVPYKAIEKIGSLDIFSAKKGNVIKFYPEPDPYVVNDERELPKVIKGLKEFRRKYGISSDEELTENKKSTIDTSNKKKDLSTDEKREISKKIIEKHAKKDSAVIKERVENSIGTNEPLSDELINAPEQRSHDDVEWKNKGLKKTFGEIPSVIKKIWEK